MSMPASSMTRSRCSSTSTSFAVSAFRCHRGRPHLVDEIGGKHMFFESDQCHGGPSRRSRCLAGLLAPTIARLRRHVVSADTHHHCPPAPLSTYLLADSLGPGGDCSSQDRLWFRRRDSPGVSRSAVAQRCVQPSTAAGWAQLANNFSRSADAERVRCASRVAATRSRVPPLRLTRATGYSASRLTRAVKTVGSRVAAGTIRDRTAG